MPNNQPEAELPNFLFVGAARSASTYIYQILKEHPEVFTPSVKDLYFFNLNYERGYQWYTKFFKNASQYKAAGECTMDYFTDPVCAERIAQDLPECRLIFCLREPVERTFDHYYWEMLTYHYVSRREFKQGLTFKEFAQKPEIVRLGKYYENMKPFFDLFPREKILVLFMDELRDDSSAFVQKIYRHLGVDESYRPPSLECKVNPLRKMRWPFLAELGYKVCNGLRSSGQPGLVSKLRDSPLFNALLFKPQQKDHRLLEEAMPELWPIYHDRDQDLEAMIGRALPAEWREPYASQK